MEKNNETIEKYQIRQAQKSLFVQPPDGFICPTDKDVKTVCIPKELKQWILIHLYRFQDISYETLFNDVHGYLRQNDLRTSTQKRTSEDLDQWLSNPNPVENLTGKEKQKWHEKTFSKALLLKSYYPIAYINRGVSYARNNNLDRAIEDLVKAIQLQPKDPFAYQLLGEVTISAEIVGVLLNIMRRHLNYSLIAQQLLHTWTKVNVHN